MSQVSFKVTWKVHKTFLPMPPSFSDLLPDGDEVSLILQDAGGQKYAVIYSRQNKGLLMQGFVNWVRNYDPQPGDIIVFELIDSKTRLFRIALDKEGPGPTDGLYLGKRKDLLGKFPTDRNFFLPIQDLVTHVFICGVTGTGKTVMGKAIIEEAILKGIPAIIVDLKGDLTSLALIFSSLQESEFEPWVEIPPDKQRREEVRTEVEKHKANLEAFGLKSEDMERLRNSASFAVFTTKFGKGIPLAIASSLAAPTDTTHLKPNEVTRLIGALSETFVKMLFPEQKPSKLKKYMTYLHEIVRHCWDRGVSLEGQDGLVTIQELIQHPPIRTVGVGRMSVDEFISPKIRNELASRVAMCLSGEEQLWFTGVPLDIDLLLSRPSSDLVPISIINLRDLSAIDDQMHAVSHLSYALLKWMNRQRGSGGKPRLIFFIDEIGGGGGRNAFFPSSPYDPPSKMGLNLLLRLGREFGVCCVFATQNPGNIDYMGLSNCQTWMVGWLQTKRDREKITQGMSTVKIHIESVDDQLRNVRSGEFLVKLKSGDTAIVQERWLMSYHRALSEDEVGKVNTRSTLEWFEKHFSNAGPEPYIAQDLDYYDILEVSPKASIEVIERAYRVLAKKYHPDTASQTMSRAEAEEKMKKLNEAYEVLSNPVLRGKYDQERRRSASHS